MKVIREKERETPVIAEADVAIAGGGLSGVIAAVASARLGAKTVLLERYAFLGGVAAMGLPIQGYCGADGSKIVRGLAEEFRLRLWERGGATDFIDCAMHNKFVVVDPELVKLVCQEMMKDAGVSLFLSAPCVDTALGDSGIEAAILEGKSGRQAVAARQFIDCTGDADLVVRSGGRWQMADTGELQASSMNFILGNVDTKEIQRRISRAPEQYPLHPLLPPQQLAGSNYYIMVGLSNLVEQAAVADPRFQELWGNVCYITHIMEGTVCVNSLHVGGLNPCDTEQLTRIELRGREQVDTIVRFMREYISGFAHCCLLSVGPYAGIRESRIIQGVKTITAEDIRAGQIPDDTIALGGYPIDFHAKSQQDGLESAVQHESGGLKFETVPVYGIPYGCLVPRGSRNLLVAGKTISATRVAMASTRLMAQCMAQGQAAGTAAALCARDDVSPSDLEVSRLCGQLTADGARLR